MGFLPSSGCVNTTVWMHHMVADKTYRIEKKLDRNCTRMLQTILNKSCRQHPMKQLYGYLSPISKTIQVRQTRHAGHCWRSKDELISDIFQWTTTHGHATADQPKTYLQQHRTDTERSLANLPGVMDDRNRCRDKESQGNLCKQCELMMLHLRKLWQK